MIYHVNSLRKKKYVSHKFSHFIIIKELLQWNDIIILNLYITKSRASKFIKQ